MSFDTEDPLANWAAVKREVSELSSGFTHASGPQSPTSIQDMIHNGVEAVRVCVYCGNHKKTDSRTVSIDTFDLGTDTFMRQNKYATYKTIAVDTSDLDVHYEFYKREQIKVSKSVATDTHDLLCKKKSANDTDVPRGIDIIARLKQNFRMSENDDSVFSLRNLDTKRNVFIKEDLNFNSEKPFEETNHDHVINNEVLSLPGEKVLNDIIINDSKQAVIKAESRMRNKSVKSNLTCNIKGRKETHGFTGHQSERYSVEGLIEESDNKEHHENEFFNYQASTEEHLGGEHKACDHMEFTGSNGKEFKLDEQLDGTRHAVEGGILPQFECNICKALFTCKQVLSDHLVGHSELHAAPENGEHSIDHRLKHQLPYNCKLCGRNFQHKEEISEHRCGAVKLKTVECHSCKKLFRSTKTLYEHTRLFHQELKRMLVKNSKRSSKPEKSTRREHEVSIQPVITKDETNFHYTMFESCEDNRRIAELSKREVSPFDSKHNENSSPKVKLTRIPIECLTCGKIFRCWSALKNHETVHTGERKYVCKVCNKPFPTKACLKSHGSTHTGLKPFVCTTCNKAFAHKDSLRTHIRTHTGERPFKCELCDQAFNRSFTLSMHKRTHTGEKKHICSACGQAFTTNSALKSHERRKHSEFPPPKVHREYKRRVTDPYICDVCGKVCTTSANLRFHSASHTGIKPYACSVCGKSYPMKQTLQRHMMRHTGERPFVCDVCGMAFYRSTTLNIHRLRHTGETPHVCSLCGKGFIQSSSLAYHLRHHNRPPKPEPKSGRRIKESLPALCEVVFEQPTHVQGMTSSGYNEHMFVPIKNLDMNGISQQNLQLAEMPNPQSVCKLFIPTPISGHIHMNENPYETSSHPTCKPMEGTSV